MGVVFPKICGVSKCLECGDAIDDPMFCRVCLDATGVSRVIVTTRKTSGGPDAPTLQPAEAPAPAVHARTGARKSSARAEVRTSGSEASGAVPAPQTSSRGAERSESPAVSFDDVRKCPCCGEKAAHALFLARADLTIGRWSCSSCYARGDIAGGIFLGDPTTPEANTHGRRWPCPECGEPEGARPFVTLKRDPNVGSWSCVCGVVGELVDGKPGPADRNRNGELDYGTTGSDQCPRCNKSEHVLGGREPSDRTKGSWSCLECGIEGRIVCGLLVYEAPDGLVDAIKPKRKGARPR